MSNLEYLNELLESDVAHTRLLRIYNHVDDAESCEIFTRAFKEAKVHHVFEPYEAIEIWDGDWDCLTGDMLDSIANEIDEQIAFFREEVRKDLEIAMRGVEDMRDAIARSYAFDDAVIVETPE
jgi:hypothetical protein